MMSTEEVRLALIEQIAQALVELNDGGDWTKQERQEAEDACEEYATVIINMLNIEISDFDGTKFTLTGELADPVQFIKKYLAEPLVKGDI